MAQLAKALVGELHCYGAEDGVSCLFTFIWILETELMPSGLQATSPAPEQVCLFFF